MSRFLIIAASIISLISTMGCSLRGTARCWAETGYVRSGEGPDVRPSDAELLRLFSGLKVGQTKMDIGNVLAGFELESEQFYFERLEGLVALRDRGSVVVFASKWVLPGGFPDIIFVEFSDKSMKVMTDALWFRQGEVRPLVYGSYQTGLMGVGVGDDVSSVFERLGVRTCAYVLNENGKWVVEFSYNAMKGRAITVVADAATGKIVRVYDGTL